MASSGVPSCNSDKRQKSIENKNDIHHGGFLHMMRPLLVVNRMLGVAPMNIAQTARGTYRVKLSEAAKSWSLVTNIVVYTILIVINEALYRDFNVSDYTIWIMRIRLVLPVLLSIASVEKQYWTRASLEKTEKLRLKQICNIKEHQMINVVVITLLAAAGTYWGIIAHETPCKVFFCTVINILPATSLAGVFSQFTCQVACLNEALSDLHRNISRQFETKTFSYMRQIMHRQHELRRMCSLLNKAYGSVLLVATAETMLEATSCIFFPHNARFMEVLTIDIVWGILYCVPLVVAASMCQRTEDKLQEIQNLKNDIQIAMTPSASAFSNWQDEAYEWDVQLMHQKMQLSADSYFYFNAGLLLTVTSAVSYYIVILYQLQVQ